MFRTAIFALSKLQRWEREGGGRERENLEKKKKKKGGEILQVEQIVAGIFLFQLNFFVIDILKIICQILYKN